MKISNFRFFSSIFFAVFIVAQAQASRIADFPQSQKLVGLFVFGDSFFDPGNNNFINTTDGFRANFSPYGRTFFNFPTGRFSNGRIIPDFIAEYANLPLIPTYLDPKNDQYIHGVNFASGGGGALVETHRGFVRTNRLNLFFLAKYICFSRALELVVDLETQLTYFKKVEKGLRKKLGESKANSLISNSVYFISIGGNDYLVASQEDLTILQTYTPTQYVDMVIANLTVVLEELYNRGGRKFAFAAVPPIGCLPRSRLVKTDGHGRCLDEATALVTLHNNLLPFALQKLADKLQGFKYTVADTYNLIQNRIDDPLKYGFKEGKAACCGSGDFRGIYSCGGKRGEEEFELCQNPNQYLFFDSLHVNERAYQQFSKLIWSGDSHVVKPYNLRDFFQFGAFWA